LLRVTLVAALFKDFDDLSSDRASQRVSTKGAAVIAGLENIHDLPRRNNRRDGHDAAAQGLAERRRDDVNATGDPAVLGRAAAGGPEEPGGVAVVDITSAP
jgi:hypothetical protein